MNITSTQARFRATWTVDITVEPGSVPDRSVPYSSVRPVPLYRPGRVTLEFTTSASHGDPAALKLENGSGYLRTARDVLQLNTTHVCGARLKKDGQPGQQVTDERFYGQDDPPEWLRELIRTTREQLT